VRCGMQSVPWHSIEAKEIHFKKDLRGKGKVAFCCSSVASKGTCDQQNLMYSSNFNPQVKEARNQSQILIGNRFHVTLRIVSLIISFK